MMSERLLTLQAVFVICQNDSDEILLLQRAGTGYLDGYWDFPSGHVEFGEGILGAASRELNEETNLIAKSDDLNLIHIDNFYVNRNYVRYTFATTKFSGEPKIVESDKCCNLKWFAKNNLPDRLTDNVRQNQFTGFSDNLTYSITDKDNYENVLKGEK